MPAEIAAGAEIRRQQAGLPLHRRVGMRKIRHIGDRQPEHLHEGIAVPDFLAGLIMLDRLRLDLPDQRALGIFLADLAGRIDGALHDGQVAVAAPRIHRGQPAVVGEQEPELLHHAVLHAVGKLDVVREHHFARGLEQRDVARGADRLGLLVVAHAVGHQHAVALGDLDVAARQDRPQLGVLADLVRGEQDRLIGAFQRLCRCGRRDQAGDYER